ncbi:Ig-like domain-containing protein [Anaerosporobacter sp.]
MKKKISLLVLVIILCILGGASKNDVSIASEITRITIGKTVNGNLKNGEEDYYSFKPTETGQLTITIKGKVPEGLIATILDETDTTTYRTKTAEYNTKKGYETVKYVINVDPITYHLQIKGMNTLVSGKYTIKTSFKSYNDSTDGKNHSLDTAYSIKNNKYYKGYITIDDTIDYYKIKVKSGANLKFSVNCNSASSITVGIIKPSDNFVSIAGSAGYNYSYDFDQSVPAGTYTIVISGSGGSALEEGRNYSITTGNYVLTKKLKTISKKTMYVGKTYKLSVTRTPKNSTEKLKYTSSNKKVVTVSSTGKLTAKAKGTATITVTGADSKIKKKVKITVKEIAVKKVQITGSYKSIYIGKSIKLKAKVTPSNATHSTVKWKSSNTAVATVTSKGTVKGKKSGSCIITATAGGKKATYKITVKGIPVSSVYLNRKSATINVGDTVTVSAKVSPSNATNKTVRFSSSNSSIATVSSRGVVTGKAAGTCTITATAGSKRATCTITVNKKATTTTTEKPKIKKITMDSSISLKVGDKAKLSIKVSPTNADKSGLTWKSSDTSVVTVKNGTITCKKEGYATIIVKSSNGVTAMCTVYVSE